MFTLLGDIRFFYNQSHRTIGTSDISVDGNEIIRDAGFETACLITIGTNARADNSDILPPTYTTRGGYFGSLLTGFQFGNKLWLIGRRKIDSVTLRLCEQYITESFSWMIEDLIAEDISVVAVRGGKYQINFLVTITRKNAPDVSFRFYANWEYQLMGGL